MSFIRDYHHLVENTEAPKVYHMWSALSALCAVVGRRYWICQGLRSFYPHLYVMLVGDPGTGKSYAMEIARDMVKDSKIVPVAATQMTKEALGKEMSHEKFAGKKFFTDSQGLMVEYNTYAIFATEFTHFVSVNPIGMVDFFTTIYNEKIYEVKTKNQGDDYVIGPYISLLGCMTPELTQGFLKQNILSGGFARRTVFVWAPCREKAVPFPTLTPSQLEARVRCIEWMKTLQHHQGEFQWTEESKTWYAEWYVDLRARLTEISTPVTRGYFESKHEQLIKTAMLIALSESTDLVLHKKYFDLGLKYLEVSERNLDRVFEGSGRNPSSSSAAKMCALLEQMQKPMNRKVLEGMFFDDAPSLNDLRDTISHLITVGRLEQQDVYITLNGVRTIIGTAIAAKGVLQRYTSDQLAIICQSVGLPQSDPNTGQSPLTGPS